MTDFEIPLDLQANHKSRGIRGAFLDYQVGSHEVVNRLASDPNQCDDLLATVDAIEDLEARRNMRVRNAGTLCRIAVMGIWLRGLGLEVIKGDELAARPMTDDPRIANLSQAELLASPLVAADKGTTQWASAKAIWGDDDRLPTPPPKVLETYQTIDEWRVARAAGEIWLPGKDRNLTKQAVLYIRMLTGEVVELEEADKKDSEFFVFRTMLGLSSVEEAARYECVTD